jgi:hypothetical protein
MVSEMRKEKLTMKTVLCRSGVQGRIPGRHEAVFFALGDFTGRSVTP